MFLVFLVDYVVASFFFFFLSTAPIPLAFYLVRNKGGGNRGRRYLRRLEH